MKIVFEKCQNARDLGGIITENGRRIKKKRILRSGNLSLITENDIKLLKEYNLRLVIDMRTKTVIDNAQNVKIAGVKYVHVPIVKELDLKPVPSEEYKKRSHSEVLLDFNLGFNGKGIEWMRSFYSDLISPYGMGQYRLFLDLLKQNTEGSVLFHCTAGKDRTGTGAILLLTLLGVDRKTILQDYLETNESVRAEINDVIALARERGVSEEIIAEFPFLNGVSELYANMIFEKIDSYKSPEEFFKSEMGIDENYIKEFRENYLE